MRVFWMTALLLAAGLAGCSGDDDGTTALAQTTCDPSVLSQHTLWFDRQHRLVEQELPPEDGQVVGNDFVGGFISDNLVEWLSEPAPSAYSIIGDVGLLFWTDDSGTIAPLAINGPPGEAYRFFNQFGTDRTFGQSYAIEYGSIPPHAGNTLVYNETFAMPKGGLIVEQGDRVRLLLTNLAIGYAPWGGPQRILFGENTPSALRFTTRCEPDMVWSDLDQWSDDVSLPLNQGLLTGSIPATEGVNYADVPFTVPDLSGIPHRLTITLEGQNGALVKGDIDLVILDAAGKEVWSIGSPYSYETGVLWQDNLACNLPTGDYVLRVNSYSGIDYQGDVRILFEQGRPVRDIDAELPAFHPDGLCHE